jgi:hypothetical protein
MLTAHLSTAKCPVFYFFLNNVLTIKVRSNLTSNSYIERTIECSIIKEQLWKNLMKWEGFDDQVGKICIKIGYIRFYLSRHL